MRRRDFFKGCLGSLCVPFLPKLKAKPKTKKIKLYVPFDKPEKFGLIPKYNYVIVEYTGKKKANAGDVMMWNEDGTVSKPREVAGIVKCDI